MTSFEQRIMEHVSITLLFIITLTYFKFDTTVLSIPCFRYTWISYNVIRNENLKIFSRFNNPIVGSRMEQTIMVFIVSTCLMIESSMENICNYWILIRFIRVKYHKKTTFIKSLADQSVRLSHPVFSENVWRKNLNFSTV